MPNLLDIKDRITSIKNTQKITRAMKMVAAAKVKKSENRVKAARPFAKAIAQAFSRALASSDGDFSGAGLKIERAIDNYPELLKTRYIKTVGLLVITSNKGLAGAYNANVIRYALNKIAALKEQGLGVKVFVVGQKGYSSLRRKEASAGFEILKKYTSISGEPNSSNAIVIAEDMASALVGGVIDNIEVITTRFKNMMSYKVSDWQVLPVEKTEMEAEARVHTIDPLMLFEPDMNHILQKLVPMYISNIIYQALLEAVASELAARMMAMSSATNNADEMIRTLTIDYNKVRQTAITGEILEVVSGADALKK